VLPARRQFEGVDVHQPNSSALGTSSLQRQVPAGSGRDVQRVIRGWVNYYNHFYKTQLRPTLKRIDLYVILWARRKFKRLRRKTKGARDWFDRLRRVDPTLFAH
jgi:Group II intron, maturase-specific domain